MQMPGRKFSVGNGGYRYGFNGKENSDEIYSGAISFEARVYDSRLGKFLSVDPCSFKYPWQTPFAYNRNSPTSIIDWLGLGDKFYGENGKLLYESKGKGTALYAVGSSGFNFIKSRFKNDKRLTQELKSISIRAYKSEDDAAKAWAEGGLTETRSDPNNVERGAQIFHAKTTGDTKVSDLYVLGWTAVGHQPSSEERKDGITGGVDPSQSTTTLDGLDIMSFKYSAFVNQSYKKYNNDDGDPNNNEPWKVKLGIDENPTLTRKFLETYSYWNVSGVIHTHPVGKSQEFSITAGGLSGGYGGDISFAISGKSTYLVTTTYSTLTHIYKLDPSNGDFNDLYFSNTREGQNYMKSKQKDILVK